MRASESTHWYKRDGSPCYTVLAKDGSPRDTTLRDARKLSLVPSVTTIIKCAAAPGLERWKLDQMLHAALTLPRQPDEKESDWIGRVWLDSQETAKKAAERGVEIHEAIQRYYDGSVHVKFLEHINGAAGEVNKWADDVKWIPEAPFAHKLGFGGKTDLHSRLAKCRLLDFKSKEFGPGDDLKTWPEQHMQLAANREGQEIPEAPCAICYVSVNNPGLARLIEVPEKDLKTGWECFKALLAYWQARNNYRSSWECQ